MAVTAAELKNLVIGDDSQWQTVVKRTQESLVLLERQADQMRTTIGASFSGLGVSLEPLTVAVTEIGAKIDQLVTITGAGFESMTEEITTAVGRVASVTETAMSEAAVSMQASIGEAAASIEGSLETIQSQATTTGATIRTVFVNGATGAEALSVSMQQVAGSSEALKASILENRTAIANYSAELAAARGSLAELAVKLVQTADATGANSIASRELQVEYDKLALITRTMATEKAALVAETQQLTAQLNVEKFATQQLAAANVEEAGAAEVAGAATDTLNFQMRRHIGTMEGAAVGMRGMGMNLAFLSEMFGATTLTSFVLFGAIAVLGTKLLEWAFSSKKASEAAADLIARDEGLADAMSVLQSRADGSSEALNNQAATYDKLAHSGVDLNSIFATFATHLESVTRANSSLLESQNTLNETIERASSLTQNLTSDNDRSRATAEMAAQAVISQRRAIADENSEREKLEGSITKDIQALANYIQATGQSVESILQSTEAQRLNEFQLGRLRAELLLAANAQEQLNAAVRNFKPPALDSTIKTMGQLRESINKAAAEGASLSELAPRINALRKATAEQVAEQATQTGVLLKNKDAQTQVTAAMKAGEDAAGQLAAKIILYDQNLKAATSTTEKHAHAVHAARPVLDEFKNGLEGLDKAITVVISHLGDESIFGSLSKNARAQASVVKDAAQVASGAINDLFSAMGAKARAIPEVLLHLDKTLAVPLLAVAEQFENLKSTLNVLNFTRAAQGLQTLDDSIKIVGHTVEMSGEAIMALPAQVIDAFAKLGYSFQATLPILNAGAKVLKIGLQEMAQDSKILLDDLTSHNEVAAAKLVNDWKKQIAQMPINQLKQALKDMKQAVEDSPIFDELKINQEAARTFDSVIRMVEQEGVRLGKTQDQINADVLTKLKEFGEQYGSQFQVIGDRAVVLWAESVNKLPGSLDADLNRMIDLLGNFSAQAIIKMKGAIGGILQIFDAIPGKLHDSAQAFITWVNRIDQILGGLHKIFSAIPANLGDALGKIIELFKGVNTQVQSTVTVVQGSLDSIQKAAKAASQAVVQGGTSMNQTSDDWVGDLEKMDQASGAWSENVNDQMGKVVQATQQGASKVIGAIGAMMAGIALVMTGHSQGGGIGAIEGALGGFITGATIGSLIAPGIGTIIGGVIGAIGGFIAGILGGSKSTAQKQQEALQLEQLKQSVQKGAQDIVNAAIDGFNKAMEFFNNLDEFTAPRKAKFQEFWKAMTRLMDGFVELAKTWSAESLAQAKAFAETIGPIVETFGNAVAGLDALSAYGGVPEKALVSFANDLALSIGHFIAVMETFDDVSLIKRARKFADRITDVISVITNAVLAFMGTKDSPGLTQYTGIPAQVFDIFAADLKLAVEKMGAIADSVDMGMVKQAQRFSDKVRSVTALIADAMAAFLGGKDSPGLADYAKIPIEVFDAFFADIVIATNKMAEVITLIDTSMLAQSELFAEKMEPVFKALKTAIEALVPLKEYTRIPADTFQAFMDNFGQAIETMIAMIPMSERFITLAKTFEDNIKIGADHLANAIAIFTASIKNLGFGLAAFGVNVTFPNTGTTVGTSSLTSGGFTPTSATGGFTPSAVTGGNSTHVHIGNITVSGDDPKARALLRALADFHPLMAARLAQG